MIFGFRGGPSNTQVSLSESLLCNWQHLTQKDAGVLAFRFVATEPAKRRHVRLRFGAVLMTPGTGPPIKDSQPRIFMHDNPVFGWYRASHAEEPYGRPCVTSTGARLATSDAKSVITIARITRPVERTNRALWLQEAKET